MEASVQFSAFLPARNSLVLSEVGILHSEPLETNSGGEESLYLQVAALPLRALCPPDSVVSTLFRLTGCGWRGARTLQSPRRAVDPSDSSNSSTLAVH